MTRLTPGVNQRDQVRMSDAEVDAFLQGRNSMSLATMGPDGRVHLVAMWYGFAEGKMAIEMKAKSQKARNLERDPRVTCLIEDGELYGELRGVELVGTAEIVTEPDRIWAIGSSVYERYFGPVTPESEPAARRLLKNRIGALLHVDKIVSWDHRKLGL